MSGRRFNFPLFGEFTIDPPDETDETSSLADPDQIRHRHRALIASARLPAQGAEHLSKLVIAKDVSSTADLSLNWYAFLVPAQKEYVAAHILKRRGIDTFVPTETRWRFPNRYAKSRKKKEEVAFPVIPRYVFAGFDGTPPWYRLFQMPLITAVVGIGDDAKRMHGRVFEAFMASQCNGSLRAAPEQRFMRSHEEFSVGDNVEILDGAFREHKVVVHEITGHMAKVMLPLFGYEEFEVRVPLDQLALVA